MSLVELQKQALQLPENERALLVVALLETLAPDVEISDDEVLQRDSEVESGDIKEISHEEFIRRVQSERGR